MEGITVELTGGDLDRMLELWIKEKFGESIEVFYSELMFRDFKKANHDILNDTDNEYQFFMEYTVDGKSKNMG